MKYTDEESKKIEALLEDMEEVGKHLDHLYTKLEDLEESLLTKKEAVDPPWDMEEVGKHLDHLHTKIEDLAGSLPQKEEEPSLWSDLLTVLSHLVRMEEVVPPWDCKDCDYGQKKWKKVKESNTKCKDCVQSRVREWVEKLENDHQ